MVLDVFYPYGCKKTFCLELENHTGHTATWNPSWPNVGFLCAAWYLIFSGTYDHNEHNTRNHHLTFVQILQFGPQGLNIRTNKISFIQKSENHWYKLSQKSASLYQQALEALLLGHSVDSKN